MKVALLGNPNTGKSSIFNLLTGLRQHVGNFPGVTVDKKVGKIEYHQKTYQLIDFPGTYSIYPRSKDEEVVYQALSDKNHADFPDALMVVIDLSNLQRNLFLFDQLATLQLPTIAILNMSDVARKKGITVDLEILKAKYPKVQFVETNARAGFGKDRILKALSSFEGSNNEAYVFPFCAIADEKGQELETQKRQDKLKAWMTELLISSEKPQNLNTKFDKILVHPVWGYVIFVGILLVLFQSIFAFAAIPMDFIDAQFTSFSQWMSEVLPQGVFFDLITQALIPGVGGVLVFVPQIALLFLFIALLEETGYLARVVFMMDRLMRPLGLNGKSVVPMLSSVACAIPGVMSARTITDWKDRMITILVAPLMSCSARIPVYTLLIAMVIPKKMVFGIFQLQGLVLFGLYALGLVGAILVSLILKFLLKKREQGFLLLELPSYKTPKIRNVMLTVWEKVSIFVLDAGKVILAISVILWFLASYGPGNEMELSAKQSAQKAQQLNLDEDEKAQQIASAKLEYSYMGYLGKGIEPLIQPLGYDWKIGISLITSFAAREVFVGSLATIYAVHDESDEKLSLQERLKKEKRSDGTLVFTLASGVSLMVFYVFAMQCMATLAVVKRETKSWKWPLIQMLYMGVMAYVGAFITFQLLS